MKAQNKINKYIAKKQQFKTATYKTDKKYPPINGEYILQSDPADIIARKIERYLNVCNLCLRVEEAEKLAALEKMTLGDVIYTLQVEENTQSEIISYFKKQLKIKVDTL
jgi:hypothetical protein